MQCMCACVYGECLPPGSPSLGSCGVLGVLRAHVLEQSVQCLLMRGDMAAAGSQLQEAVDTCHAHTTLVYSHRAVLHTMLVGGACAW